MTLVDTGAVRHEAIMAQRCGGHADRLRVQRVIAALRRVLVMVSSIRGFVEGVR
jgi:hypothetical protein